MRNEDAIDVENGENGENNEDFAEQLPTELGLQCVGPE